MKEGRYGEGLLAGLEEVRKILTGESTLEADARMRMKKETKDFVIKACKIWWGIGAVVVILLLLIQLMEAQTSKSDAEIKETKHNCNLAVIGGGVDLLPVPLIPIYFLLEAPPLAVAAITRQVQTVRRRGALQVRWLPAEAQDEERHTQGY